MLLPKWCLNAEETVGSKEKVRGDWHGLHKGCSKRSWSCDRAFEVYQSSKSVSRGAKMRNFAVTKESL